MSRSTPDYNNIVLEGTNGNDDGAPFTTTTNQEAASEPEGHKKAASNETHIDGTTITMDKQSLCLEPSHVSGTFKSIRNKFNNWSDGACYEQIKKEINTLLKTVYIAQTLPLQQSVLHLREFNDKLISYKRSTVQPEQNRSKSIEFGEANNSGTSHYDICTKLHENYLGKVTEKEYIKERLYMEMNRLELVMRNTNIIPSHLALMFVQHLNQLLERQACKGYMDFNMLDTFTRDEYKDFPNNDTLQDSQSLLPDEINRARDTLLDSEKMRMEVALDIIILFNVQLESFLQYQTSRDKYSCLSASKKVDKHVQLEHSE